MQIDIRRWGGGHATRLVRQLPFGEQLEMARRAATRAPWTVRGVIAPSRLRPLEPGEWDAYLEPIRRRCVADPAHEWFQVETASGHVLGGALYRPGIEIGSPECLAFELAETAEQVADYLAVAGAAGRAALDAVPVAAIPELPSADEYRRSWSESVDSVLGAY